MLHALHHLANKQGWHEMVQCPILQLLKVLAPCQLNLLVVGHMEECAQPPTDTRDTGAIHLAIQVLVIRQYHASTMFFMYG